MSSAPSSVATQTRERQIGDLFEYTINQPVTIRRNQSALVPIVLSAFSGRSVLLYQKQARPENPMRCVEFENTTGLTLEGGPVTVLEEGRYVGEAMLDTLKPTERRLVGYAVELAVRVTDEINSYQDLVHHVIIENGVLWTHSASVRKTTYTFTSKSEKDQTLFLDHPRPGGDWQLREPAQPSEVTESMWRFKLTIAAQKTTQFVVVAASPFTQTFQLSNLTQPTLALWLQSRFIDNATEQKLKQSFDLRREISATQEKENHLHEERERLHTDQERVRNNLQALGERVSEKELRERYIRTLTQHEDRLEVIEQELLNNQKLRDELNTRLTTLLTAISWQQKL
jgi:hypothetical protein